MRAVLIAMFTAASLVACSARSAPTSADVYFRPFEATSIVRLTESEMVTSAGSEYRITDQARLTRIRKLFELPCKPSLRRETEMDLRLLIYFQGTAGRTTWKASQFDFYDSSTGKICEMPGALRESLSTEFGAASGG